MQSLRWRMRWVFSVSSFFTAFFLLSCPFDFSDPKKTFPYPNKNDHSASYLSRYLPFWLLVSFHSDYLSQSLLYPFAPSYLSVPNIVMIISFYSHKRIIRKRNRDCYEGLDGVNWQLTNGQKFNWKLTNRLKFNWQLTFVEGFTDNWQKILLP